MPPRLAHSHSHHASSHAPFPPPPLYPTPSSSSSPFPARRILGFARLRTSHESSLRALVESSWDSSSPSPYPMFSLPPRSATDASPSAIHAALKAAEAAEAAAKQAATASAAASAAADLARHLAAPRAHTPQPVSLSKSRRVDVPSVSSLSPLEPTLSSIESERGSESQYVWRPRFITSVPLGKKWSFDLVAVWHNAIRLDLGDLEHILGGLINCGCVTLQELRALFAWFSTFEAFTTTCLKAEEEVLYPWLEQWGHIDGNLSTANRITTKGAIIRLIRDTAACAALLGLHNESSMRAINGERNYYDALKVGYAQAGNVQISAVRSDSSVIYFGVLRKVAKLVEEFSSLLLEYFEEEETCLPSMIEMLYDREDMLISNIERRFLRSIWKCGRKDESTVMVLRAVEEAPYARNWTNRNLRRMERFTVSMWKRRYNLGRGAVTHKFRQRKLGWERMLLNREWAAQAERRR